MRRPHDFFQFSAAVFSVRRINVPSSRYFGLDYLQLALFRTGHVLTPELEIGEALNKEHQQAEKQER